MNTQRERLYEFIDFIGYSVREFERELGVSNGTIRHLGDTLSANVKQKVSAKFPQLSQVWLLTGRGDMLMPIPQTTNVNVDMGDSIHHNSAPVVARGAQNVTVDADDKDKIIAEQQAEIKALKEQISDLTKSILNLTKQQIK